MRKRLFFLTSSLAGVDPNHIKCLEPGDCGFLIQLCKCWLYKEKNTIHLTKKSGCKELFFCQL